MNENDVTLAARFRNDEQAESTMGLGAIVVGTRQQCQHIGTRAERAPCLDAVDDIAGLSVGTSRCRGGDFEVGNIAAVVGLGDRDGRHYFRRCQLGQPFGLLLLGATLQQGPRQDFGAGDQ